MYVVYVNYNTGNSFHIEIGQIAWIDITNNKNDAEYTVNYLTKNHSNKKHYDKKDFENKTIILPSGKPLIISSYMWTGYFERVNFFEYKEIKNLSTKKLKK